MKAISVFVLFLLFAQLLFAQDRITGRAFATRSEVIAQHGMVRTSQPLATQTAIDILKGGWNKDDISLI